MSDIKALTEQLQELTKYGIQGLSDEQVKEQRKAILALDKQCKQALAATSQKDHNYNESLVMDYVQQVLADGYNLVETKLAQNKQLIEAQKLTRFKPIIKACVQQSNFSYKKFKIKELLYQRNQIEQSSTLHELRQNVKAIIGPLRMYREANKEPEPIQYKLTTEDELILEIEQLKKIVAEKERVISELTSIYNDGLVASLDITRKVKAIDDFKKEHSCSDDQACKVFKLSRMTLSRYRKELKEAADRVNAIDDSTREEVENSRMLHKPVTLDSVVITPQITTVWDDLEDSALLSSE